MIRLDTNTCIYIISQRSAAVLARFQQHRLGDLGLCSGVAAELAISVAKSGSARRATGRRWRCFWRRWRCCLLMTGRCGLGLRQAQG